MKTIKEIHQKFLQTTGVCIDTRVLAKGQLFIAIKGLNFDGNLFVDQAIELGAKYVITQNADYANHPQVICVDDTLQTLQQLAHEHRKQMPSQIIAITGSNGKTTTKELINAVLCQTYQTIYTQGNYNNHIGVPLTLLRIKPTTQIAIIEMGANHLKEIALLSDIVAPDYGYITNFGKAHLEGFGSVEGVIQAKSELYDYLTAHHKKIFYNLADAIQRDKLSEYADAIPTLTDECKVLDNNNDVITIQYQNHQIQTQLVGGYNFDNLVAALTIAVHFKVPISQIKTALEKYTPDNNRSQLMVRETNKIILDAYNANPSSMIAAIENLSKMKGELLVICGDMFELGADSLKEHQKIADLLTQKNIEALLVGTQYSQTQSSAQVFETTEALAQFITQNPIENKTILIKGSRGMAMEQLVEKIFL